MSVNPEGAAFTRTGISGGNRSNAERPPRSDYGAPRPEPQDFFRNPGASDADAKMRRRKRTLTPMSPVELMALPCGLLILRFQPSWTGRSPWSAQCSPCRFQLQPALFGYTPPTNSFLPWVPRLPHLMQLALPICRSPPCANEHARAAGYRDSRPADPHQILHIAASGPWASTSAGSR